MPLAQKARDRVTRLARRSGVQHRIAEIAKSLSMRPENIAQRRLAADDGVLVLSDRRGGEIALLVGVIADVLPGVEPGVEDRFAITSLSAVHAIQSRHRIA